MRLTNTEDYEAYQKYLLTHPEEIDLLRKALTINVTKFFRDPDVFEVIQQKILPDLARHKKLIRIWCAGCATGEEPYSIAILAHELMALHRDLNVTIYATDIDTEALQKAMAGIYDLKALENVDKHRIRRHFISRDDGTFEVCPHLRELVKFRQHDLMSGVPVAKWPTSSFAEMSRFTSLRSRRMSLHISSIPPFLLTAIMLWAKRNTLEEKSSISLLPTAPYKRYCGKRHDELMSQDATSVDRKSLYPSQSHQRLTSCA